MTFSGGTRTWNNFTRAEILVRLGDRHVIDAELLSKPPNRRQPHAGRQLTSCDAIDDLFMHLHEKWAAMPFDNAIANALGSIARRR